jgi:hypothetical protein
VPHRACGEAQGDAHAAFEGARTVAYRGFDTEEGRDMTAAQKRETIEKIAREAKSLGKLAEQADQGMLVYLLSLVEQETDLALEKLGSA